MDRLCPYTILAEFPGESRRRGFPNSLKFSRDRYKLSMNLDVPPLPPAPPSARRQFLRSLLLAITGTLVLFAVFRGRGRLGKMLGNAFHEPQGGLAVGNPLPPITAVGWMNGDAPEPGALKGKVLVIEAWAYWCGPCLQAAPELIALHKQFSPRGVEFMGLTAEGEEYLDESKRFLEETGIPWRNGYGAVETLIALQADAIPQVWVVDHTGTIIWNLDSTESIEASLELALQRKAK